MATNPASALNFPRVRHWNNRHGAERDTQFRYRRDESSASSRPDAGCARGVQFRRGAMAASLWPGGLATLAPWPAASGPPILEPRMRLSRRHLAGGVGLGIFCGAIAARYAKLAITTAA